MSAPVPLVSLSKKAASGCPLFEIFEASFDIRVGLFMLFFDHLRVRLTAKGSRFGGGGERVAVPGRSTAKSSFHKEEVAGVLGLSPCISARKPQ